MITLHKIYFFFYKMFLYLNGIKKGTLLLEYSEEKGKNIKGVVTQILGDSIDKKQYMFRVGINWLEPMQGYDSRFYSWGSYSYKDVKEMRRA